MSQFAKNLSNAMTPMYVDKFQLSHAPFSERYTEALYFEDETRTEILKKLAHLTDYTNLILFLQGAAGLGKTSLLRHRLNTNKSNWRICYFNTKDYVNSDALIEKLFTDFQLKYNQDSRDKEPQSLHEQIESLRQMGQTPVLIIDDIEQLNPKLIPLLQSLTAYKDGQSPIVRLIIAGEDAPKHFQDIIPKEKDRPAIKYLPIPPLSEKDTTAYIKFRLAQSGYKQVEPFNKNKLKKIYLDSKGFPKYINQLADHVLGQYAQTSGDKQNLLPISDEANRYLKISAAVLGSLAAITLAFLLMDTSSENDLNSNEQSITQLDIPAESTKEKTSPESFNKEVNTQTVPKLEKKHEIVIAKEETQKKDPSIKAEIKSDPKPRVVTEQKKKEALPKPAPKPKKTIDKNLAWIKAQKPTNYTLQLIGTGSEKAAKSFIKKHKITNDARYFHTTRKGKDWYSVIYKSYPNAKSARNDLKKLPSSLRKIKPWIRQFRDFAKK